MVSLFSAGKSFPQSKTVRRKSTQTAACCDSALTKQNGGRGGRGRLRRGGGRRVRWGGRRPREKKEALLQGAPVYDVRIWRRSESLHRVGGYLGGPGDRVHHRDDSQSHVHRTPGSRPGGGHSLPDPERPQEVRQSQRPSDHERGAEESPQSFRRG